jgi:hypothetical protein
MKTEVCAGGAAGAPKAAACIRGELCFDKRFYQGTVAAKMLLREPRRIAVAERSSIKINRITV